MTKLPPVVLPLTPLENNRNPTSSSSSVPHKGVLGIKTESNYDQLTSSDNLTTLTNSEPITLNFEDNNSVIPRNIDESELGKDVTVEESDKTLSDSLIEVSQEITTNKRKLPSNYVPLWGLTSICGRRKEMEDSVVALPRFLKIPSSMLDDGPHSSSARKDSIAHVFGVYDGHGGCQVANYCQDRLHLVLAEEIGIAKENWLNETEGCNSEEQWMRIFLRCFNKLDNEVGGFPVIASEIPGPPIAPDSVGSTAVVAVVCSTHIIIANCGDSRAVLYRGKVPIPLTIDHKPNSEDECARIEAAGGKVIKWDGYRVSGFLAVSRSIGDRYLRPYVIADPQVMLVRRAREDECLILASDGLWDVMTNQEACELARWRMLMWHKRNGGGDVAGERGNGVDPAAQDAADCLSRLAFQRGSGDNISVVVVDLKSQRKFK
ncbi:hypothetical protein ABFS82_10G085200 [Erythranthe guttata]|nr:PREDICTED: probable protein phosphatase 2C 50 isoform X2 [Erythranthe guttata]|eukprot:XP_012850508.1 PREDICTED: probable protein phosphatase 2C 50 isoform X2 [Erythranthe guttata]